MLSKFQEKLTSTTLKSGLSYRDQFEDLYDVFEPALIYCALVLSDPSKKVSLGHLIFGQATWDRYCVQAPAGNDPLTKMFVASGVLYFCFCCKKILIHVKVYGTQSPRHISILSCMINYKIPLSHQIISLIEPIFSKPPSNSGHFSHSFHPICWIQSLKQCMCHS